jgi:predicted GNAT family acetyltransferase
VQLVAQDLDATGDPEAVALGLADVPEMLELTGRTKPGPFVPRTVELGGYLGIRRAGRLVAMAGERMRPPGFAEISAVCTDEAWRGHGYAARLTRAVAAGIAARGETPFLHAAADNDNAIRLYKSLGFVHRRDVVFIAATPPK